MLKDQEKEERRVSLNKIRKNKIRIRVFTSARGTVTGAMTTGHLVCKGPAGAKNRLIFTTVTFTILWFFSTINLC